jgi:nucleoside-diphosphate-sugar epimerase
MTKNRESGAGRVPAEGGWMEPGLASEIPRGAASAHSAAGREQHPGADITLRGQLPAPGSRLPTPGSDEALDDLLSAPSPAVVRTLLACPGDVVVLGAGGKMGPTLARMVRRALDGEVATGGGVDGKGGGVPAPRDGRSRRVVAVSRWGSDDAAARLREAGVETVRADLTDRAQVERLPDAPNVIYMAGQKFGTRGDPSGTWAMNVVAPVLCAERYAGSRVVAFSTGNVYPLTPVARGGSAETDAVTPAGEYAASCVGRERVFEHFSRARGTPVAIYRLNYAVDLRYGVLVDVALRVLRGEPVDVTMGHVNVIWQGDANRAAVECLAHAASPPFVVNVTGPEVLRVRDVAHAFGRHFGRPPVIVGEEAPDALLSNSARMTRHLAPPSVTASELIAWVAEWVGRGGTLLGKPTKFEVRDGTY